MTTLKQRLGAWLVPRLPVNPWVFRTFRVELNAMTVRLLNRLLPGRIAQQRALRQRTGVLVNVGCGPFGQEGWVNLDLFPAPGVTLRVDCRHGLPLGDGSARAEGEPARPSSVAAMAAGSASETRRAAAPRSGASARWAGVSLSSTGTPASR